MVVKMAAFYCKTCKILPIFRKFSIFFFCEKSRPKRHPDRRESVDELREGDLIFYEADYIDEKKKPQHWDITHIEVRGIKPQNWDITHIEARDKNTDNGNIV